MINILGSYNCSSPTSFFFPSFAKINHTNNRITGQFLYWLKSNSKLLYTALFNLIGINPTFVSVSLFKKLILIKHFGV
jgi:hypothetical protein